MHFKYLFMLIMAASYLKPITYAIKRKKLIQRVNMEGFCVPKYRRGEIFLCREFSRIIKPMFSSPFVSCIFLYAHIFQMKFSSADILESVATTMLRSIWFLWFLVTVILSNHSRTLLVCSMCYRVFFFKRCQWKASKMPNLLLYRAFPPHLTIHIFKL